MTNVRSGVLRRIGRPFLLLKQFLNSNGTVMTDGFGGSELFVEAIEWLAAAVPAQADA
jgi:hypothetical protein